MTPSINGAPRCRESKTRGHTPKPPLAVVIRRHTTLFQGQEEHLQFLNLPLRSLRGAGALAAHERLRASIAGRAPASRTRACTD